MQFYQIHLILLLAGTFSAPLLARHDVSSPDGSITATVDVVDGRLTIAVRRGTQPVLLPSPLGVTVNGLDIGQGVTLPGNVLSSDEDGSYDHLGHASRLRNRRVQALVPVGHPRGRWTLEVRAADDGVAWRYVVPGVGRRTISGEATAFTLPGRSNLWSHHNTKDYQGQYKRLDASGPFEKTLTLPMTIELSGGGYACLAEADVSHYSGMTLRPLGNGTFQAAFEDDPKGWQIDGKFATPWRVCIAVQSLNDLVGSSIIYNLCPPPDPTLFPQGSKTAWIRPGRSLWQWWFYGWDGMNFDRQHGFIDAAAALGCDYYLIDDGWEDKKRGWITETRDQFGALRELAGYARDRNVRLWVWRHWKAVEKPAERETFFRKLADIGVAGVKLDFLNSESHERLAFYRDTLEAAAKHKLMVNFHGANKSAGEQRTWPNEMTREAVFGLEENKGGPVITLEHYAAVPFTACIGGAKDFTPTTFRKGNAGTTQAFQLATAVVYTSPVLCWANRPEELLQSPALPLMKTLPTVWDETIVLPGSEIGRFVAFARRAGDEWWIAILNAKREPRDYELDLAFLKSGEWTVQAAQDIPGDPWPLQMAETKGSAGQTLTVKLESAGGYVARFKPQ